MEPQPRVCAQEEGDGILPQNQIPNRQAPAVPQSGGSLNEEETKGEAALEKAPSDVGREYDLGGDRIISNGDDEENPCLWKNPRQHQKDMEILQTKNEAWNLLDFTDGEMEHFSSLKENAGELTQSDIESEDPLQLTDEESNTGWHQLWSDVAPNCMLDAALKLRKQRMKPDDWQRIADEVMKGSNEAKTIRQCKVKLDNLIRKYRYDSDLSSIFWVAPASEKTVERSQWSKEATETLLKAYQRQSEERMKDGNSRMKSVETCGSWNLPNEIWGLVSEKVTSVIDYIRFRAVCSCWRGASTTKPLHIPPMPPLLMIPKLSAENDDGVHVFFDPEESRVLRLTLPEMIGTRCHASYRSWLLLEDHASNELFLFNPVTHFQSTLPSFATPVDQMVVNQGDQAVGDRQRVTFNLGGVNETITKVTFSGDPMDSSCLVLLIRRGMLTFCCRVGDRAWMWVYGGNAIAGSRFTDAVCQQDKILLLYESAIIIVDINDRTNTITHRWDSSYIPSPEKFFVHGLPGVFILSVNKLKRPMIPDVRGVLPESDVGDA